MCEHFTYLYAKKPSQVRKFSPEYAFLKCVKHQFTYLKRKNSFQVRISCDTCFEITYLFRKNALQVRKYRIKTEAFTY